MVVVLALIELLIVVLLVLVILPFSSLLMLLLRGFGGTAGGTEEFFVPAPERLIFPLPEFRSVFFSGDIDLFGRASELITGEDLAEAEGLNFKRPK